MSTHTILGEEGRQRVLAAINQLNMEHAWDIEIKRHKNRRTLSQNNLMWMWYTTIGNHLGYAPPEIHEILMKMFLAPRVIILDGEEYELRSTSKLSTEEMTDYLDNIYRWAAGEQGIILPLPEELHGSTP